MSDATGLAEPPLGLEGFRVLKVTETPDGVASRSRPQPMSSDVTAEACGPSPRSARASTFETYPASADRPGSSGSSAVGAAAIPTARSGPGPKAGPTWRPGPSSRCMPAPRRPVSAATSKSP